MGMITVAARRLIEFGVFYAILYFAYPKHSKMK